ncbi:apolipoprotein N-acyltransferase [Agromyces aerolatus]|uniref:apolipoprotein N-acyltransferase n=1 Tax=Agromyces sp. LY-1074 TaxID=3074080 RepID=UPI00285CB681|nr:MULTISPECIES: apolipoprotein N-acyltransferase [unclassified Agromyces]MDR5700096.1 apolipoprotein N-acyltransferase [Agromyces sp. LY-1074]MDR5706536.1 apolipoprotein N-acyltransferase [Agromyces sp. LY-1358]
MPDRPRPLLPWWAAIPVAAAAGLVYDLGFPEAGIWPLAFAGIALTLLTLIGRSTGGALLVGYVFGATFYLLHVDWTSRYLGPVPWLALALLEAAFVALGALAITLAYRWVPRAWLGRWVRLAALPAIVAGLWVAREVSIGTVPYGGFPWGRAAHSQALSPFAEVVSWAGQLGLSAVMVFIVAAAIEWVRLAAWRDLRTLLPAVLVTVIAIALPAWPTTASGELRVGSVQGNGPAGYFDARQRGDILASQLDATTPILDEPGIDVLVWPEGSVDIDPTRDRATAGVLDRLFEAIDGPVIVNTVTTEAGATEDEEPRFYNTSLNWRAGEGAVQEYSKRHPVPFGEYIPDREFYMFFAPDLISLVQRGYSPGTQPPVFDVAGTLAGLAICFDVIYDEVIWEGARDGAELYVLQTNNADFRGTDENLQQLAIARLRAIETGRSVVNISTVGTSQVMTADGRTIDSLPADEPGAMVTDVPLRTGLTPAVVLGPWVPGAITALALAALVAAGLMARRRRASAGPASAPDMQDAGP